MKFSLRSRKARSSATPAKPRSRRRRSRLPMLEKLEFRWVRASLPFGATAADTGEFMLGRIAVTPVLLESNGTVDANTENWTKTQVDQVMANLAEGLGWWQDLLATKSSVHKLDFVIDRKFVEAPSPTVYEPISRVSNDFYLWTQEFLIRQGYDSNSSIEQNMRAFNQAQREKMNADWSFTILVANSQNDADGMFATGGSFLRAFAFAGGLFFVTPSTRPASTLAHETGHIFWARDEYAGGGNYYAKRGYYNTQNTNAFDGNPTPNFQQAPSIMSSGTSLDTAWAQHVSPASTLAMIGWQDSDSDGVFDCLDVPLLLDGVGRIDTQTGSYRFVGKAKVQTLPNRNSSGLGNDITLNKVSRIEARFDGGTWQTIKQPNAYETQIDVSIALAGRTSGTLELRAVDDATGQASNIFDTTIGALPDATAVVGINGFAWNDTNSNGLFDAVEFGIANQQVRLVDSNGQLLSLEREVEPDALQTGLLSPTAYAGIRLTAVGDDTNGLMMIASDLQATTGTKVFRPYSISSFAYAETWNERRQLKVEFVAPTSLVSVDVIGSAAGSYGRLEIYDAAGNLLDRVTSAPLANGQSQRLEIGRGTAEIAYAIVRGHMGSGIKIDNLRYGPKTQTVTENSGRYSFANLPAGDYRVQIVPAGSTSTVTSPAGSVQTVSLQNLQSQEHVDFGIHTASSAWHNVNLAADVNDDGLVTPYDVLVIINLLNQNVPADLSGSGLPNKPFVDVSNDGFLTAFDALLAINSINKGSSVGGEAEKQGASGAINGGSASGSGSFEAEATYGLFTTAADLSTNPSVYPTTAANAAGSIRTRLASSRAAAPVLASEFTPRRAGSEACLIDQLALDRPGLATSDGETNQQPEAATDSIMADLAIVARLNATSWIIPEPCNCSQCQALASI